MSTEDIIAALTGSDRADLANIRQYIQWIKIRRRVNRRFYFQAHWVTWPVDQLPDIHAHWI